MAGPRWKAAFSMTPCPPFQVRARHSGLGSFGHLGSRLDRRRPPVRPLRRAPSHGRDVSRAARAPRRPHARRRSRGPAEGRRAEGRRRPEASKGASSTVKSGARHRNLSRVRSRKRVFLSGSGCWGGRAPPPRTLNGPAPARRMAARRTIRRLHPVRARRPRQVLASGGARRRAHRIRRLRARLSESPPDWIAAVPFGGRV